MAAVEVSPDDERELARLRDEVEQLRTALEASTEEAERLAGERERLLGRVGALSRDLQAANAAYAAAGDRTPGVAGSLGSRLRGSEEAEELRVAFEELQVLTEELEVANTSLQETNRVLDLRVDERTRELELKNAALAESERRFRTLVEGVPQLVWRAVDGGRWTWASPQWTDLTGQAAPESRGWGWLEPVHPDDREAAKAAWAKAESSGALNVGHRVLWARSGRYRWFETRATPVRDEHGRIVEWLGTSTDVDELRRLQERQRLLLHELQHRVRNTLAVVRSITTSTGETSDTVEHFASHLEGRLNALARTQAMLTRAPGEGVDLEGMIREEMLAQAAPEAQIELEGPDVRLSPKAAEVLALAVHELATNAVKYGAFCDPAGRVSVRWRSLERDGREWLSLLWRESGVRVAAAAPRRQGFGTELIEMRVPYELEGRGALLFRPGGVCCEIEFPLSAGASILQTDFSIDEDQED